VFASSALMTFERHALVLVVTLFYCVIAVLLMCEICVMCRYGFTCECVRLCMCVGVLRL
jgi:hypothetical protein